MKTFKYSLIRVTPNLEKGETINVGLIVYHDSDIDVRMLNSVSKLKAIDKDLTLDYLEDLSTSLFDLSQKINNAELLPCLLREHYRYRHLACSLFKPTKITKLKLLI